MGGERGGGRPQRRHLRRLERIFDAPRVPLFFLTVCVRDRRALLADDTVIQILVRAWQEGETVHGWSVGRFVVMPDHVHFFAAPASAAGKELSRFVEGWKRWTRRRIRGSGLDSFAWQAEFFDHLMRSSESYSGKWDYVRLNPARAGLVRDADDWPYQGEVHSLRW